MPDPQISAPIAKGPPPFFLVVISGAIGGMVYWVLQVATGIAPFGFRWYGSVPAALLVGGVAAFLGVYLLANSDTTSRGDLKHTLAFALVCGIAWSTVIAGAQQQVTSATGAVRADTAQDKVASLQNALKTDNRAEVGRKVTDTAAATAHAVQSLSSTADDQVKTKIVDSSQEAVKTISEAARIDPAASIEALKTVGTNATTVGATGVRVSVLDALSTIEKNNPAVAAQAMAARQVVALQVTSPAN